MQMEAGVLGQACCTLALQQWLAKHPRFHLHFTPTSSSWLNQVERWFRELTNKALRRRQDQERHRLPDRHRADAAGRLNPRPATVYLALPRGSPRSRRRGGAVNPRFIV